MKWFKNLKIGKKIGVYSFIAVIVTLIIAYTGISKMLEMNNNAKLMYAENAVPIVKLDKLAKNIYEIRLKVADVFIAENAGLKNNFNEIKKMENEVEADFLNLKNTRLNKEEESYLKSLESESKDFVLRTNEIIQLVDKKQMDKAMNIREGIFKKDAENATKTLISFVAIFEHKADSLDNVISMDKNSADIEIYSVLIFGIALMIILGIYLSRLVGNPLSQLTDRLNNLQKVGISNLAKGANQMSNGDLNIKMITNTEPLEINSEDEIGLLAKNVNNIIKMTQETVVSVGIAAETIKQLVHESGTIVKATIDGDLAKRANADKFNGEYRAILEGLNEAVQTIKRPIDEAKDVLEIMATGDFTERITGDYPGDYLTLKASINQVSDSLTEAFQKVMDAAEATASASTQISSSAEEMAAGSQEQSAQTGEVATAVQQMTATIFEATKNATKAAELAKNSGNTAVEGGNVVKQTITGIENIAKDVAEAAEKVEQLGVSSNKIGEIVQVINDIADQTNLLALNAAIEAARAGEQGRGFAVVADEVRKLAERTTSATKEIAEMIKQIQTQTAQAVESMRTSRDGTMEGKELAVKSGNSLEDIIKMSDDVISEVEQVATASEEQSATVEEISKNVTGINTVAQESAVGVEQIAHASEDLNRLTENLQSLVQQFKISDKSQQYSVNGNGNIHKDDFRLLSN